MRRYWTAMRSCVVGRRAGRPATMLRGEHLEGGPTSSATALGGSTSPVGAARRRSRPAPPGRGPSSCATLPGRLPRLYHPCHSIEHQLRCDPAHGLQHVGETGTDLQLARLDPPDSLPCERLHVHGFLPPRLLLELLPEQCRL